MINIVIFGPPGAGKGTQAAKVSEKYGFIHLSTGEVIRDHVRRGTELGRTASEQMQGGGLASDELVIGIISDFIGSLSPEIPGVIYDGFPRTLPQAGAFDAMLADHGQQVSGMLSLEVPEDELIRRLTERGKISGRSDDQSIDVIRNRIEVYHNETAPLIEYYNKQGKFHAIPGHGGIEAVFGRLCEAIDEL